MPGWSTNVANEFIRLAVSQGKLFDQTSVQRLIYIAHGLCLATSGQPLTGDRPEAWENGPIYRRLAEALSGYGSRPVTDVIATDHASEEIQSDERSLQFGLDFDERRLLERVLDSYGRFSAAQLGILTCGTHAPWSFVYAAGAGINREISHALVREQFEQHSQI